jgi:hypothetical protein
LAQERISRVARPPFCVPQLEAEAVGACSVAAAAWAGGCVKGLEVTLGEVQRMSNPSFTIDRAPPPPRSHSKWMY